VVHRTRTRTVHASDGDAFHETRNRSKVVSDAQASLDLQTAQQRFQLQVPDEFKCPSDNGLTQTMNSAFLRYVTNFSDSVFMTIAQRQTKTINPAAYGGTPQVRQSCEAFEGRQN
jgi:hypothetical protein